MTVATRNQPDVTTAADASEYFADVDASMQVDGEVAGQFAPHEAATPDMTVIIDAGRLMDSGTLATQSQQTTTTISAPSTNPRIDRIVINETDGSYSIVTGSEAASPSAPAIPAGYLPCCQFQLETTTTEITNSLITDERVTQNKGFHTGTWTPTLQDNSFNDSEGQTYSAQNGSYTRIGSAVFITFKLTMTSIGTLDNSQAYIGGLPFTPNSTGDRGGVTVTEGDNLAITANASITGYIESGAARIVLKQWNNTLGGSTCSTFHISANGSIIGHGFYFV